MSARIRITTLSVAAVLLAATAAQADQSTLASAPEPASFAEIAKGHLPPAVVGAAREARELLQPPATASEASEADPSTQLTVVTPVPEPETYALMLAGLGVLGAAAKRRAAQRKAAATR